MKSPLNYLFLTLFCGLLVMVICLQFSSGPSELSSLSEALKTEQEISDETYKGKDIAIFFTDEAQKKNLEAEDIRSISIIHLKAEKKWIDIIAADISYLDDCETIEQCIDKLNQFPEINVDSYLFVGPEEIRELVETGMVMHMYVSEEDLSPLNENIRKLEKMWGDEGSNQIPGPSDAYDVNGIQAAAFAETFSEGELERNTWHFNSVIWTIAFNLNGCGFRDLSQKLKTLDKVSTNIDEGKYQQILAVLKQYRCHRDGYFNLKKNKISYYGG